MANSPDQKPAASGGIKVSGCVQALGLSCSMLMLLIVVLSLVMGKVLENMGQNPSPHTTFGAEAGMVLTVEDGQQIFDALSHYHASEGTYPDSLLQLVPQSLPDKSVLHSPLDTDSDPNHVSWVYIKPAPNAPSDAVVLQLAYSIPIGSGKDKQYMQYEMVFLLDGTRDPEKPVGKSKGFLSLMNGN